MPEWKKYTGAQEQLDEMRIAKHGVILKHHDGEMDTYPLPADTADLWDFIDPKSRFQPAEYLICEPHLYAEMICQWAKTGQPVYWKARDGSENTGTCSVFMPHFAHPEMLEYSFSPFE